MSTVLVADHNEVKTCTVNSQLLVNPQKSCFQCHLEHFNLDALVTVRSPELGDVHYSGASIIRKPH